jgi:2'-5' RNA ligase
MEALGYSPHITLTIYDDVDFQDLFVAFHAVTAVLSRMTIRFEGLGYFHSADAIVLWAEPALPEQVHAACRTIHSTIPTNLCHPLYRSDAWIPHCSLATAIEPERREEALALVRRPFEPVEVVFDTADCVSFLPVEVLRERALPDVA